MPMGFISTRDPSESAFLKLSNLNQNLAKIAGYHPVLA